MGTVPGATTVYSVKKGSVAEDYHENVNAKVYMTWFKKLCQLLTTPSIIVLDNARLILHNAIFDFINILFRVLKYLV